MPITLQVPGSFAKYRKKLSSERDDAVILTLRAFMVTPYLNSLNFEPVAGRKGYYTIRTSIADRILLRKTGGESYEVVAVGNHDLIYNSYFRK
jgi:hypothetical protein